MILHWGIQLVALNLDEVAMLPCYLTEVGQSATTVNHVVCSVIFHALIFINIIPEAVNIQIK